MDFCLVPLDSLHSGLPPSTAQQHIDDGFPDGPRAWLGQALATLTPSPHQGLAHSSCSIKVC